MRATLVILEVANASERNDAVTAILVARPERPVSVLLEGALLGPDVSKNPEVHVHLLGFGCPCCIGSLPLQVTLTRILRHERPKLIVLAPQAGVHRDTLVTFLTDTFSNYLDVENILP